MNYICCLTKQRRSSNIRLTFSLAPRQRTHTASSSNTIISNDVLDDERPSVVSSKLGILS